MCFSVSYFQENCNSQTNEDKKKQKKTSQTQTEKKRDLDLFLGDSTTAMSEGPMETEVALLLVHRPTHLISSTDVCQLSHITHLFGKFERQSFWIVSFKMLI